MIVIWRGWGFIVLLFAFAAAALAAAIIERGGVHSAPIIALIDLGASALAALGIWAFTYKIDRRPGRVLIDKKTGREFTVRPSAGSLFFIKTRYWPYIVLVIGALVAVAALFPNAAGP
jgi:hypothetical protein